MINRINTIIILIVIFLVSSCSSVGAYNKPFINTTETLKISEGMTQQQILMNIGQPYYVESGKGGSEVVWVYEVRTILVKSELSNAQPNKFHPDQKHAGSHHKLQITFKNDKVTSWGPLDQNKSSKKDEAEEEVADDKEESSAEKTSTKKKKGSSLLSKFSLTSKLGMGFHDDAGGAVLGGNIGYGPWGAEIISMDGDNGSYGFSMMLTYDKPMNKFFVQTGVGMTSTEWEEVEEYTYGWNDQYTGYDYYYRSREGIGLRLGIGTKKTIGPFIVKPIFAMNLGLGEEGSGFSTLTLNVGFGS
ncbi:MAG: hypothetical protein CMG21_01780 [Candidatus Marinimicrobia bacterium]|nr:hypothetical protein [Candidatus Neomarinimicrobiota bacterium]